MKVIIILFLILSVSVKSNEEIIYTQAYGDPQNPAIIFLHGGPGYNSYSFEKSTAKKLSERGFFVIVYDQYGCGRSQTGNTTKYTFDGYFQDIINIYDNYNIKNASLIGHSWGGLLSIKFTEKYPEKVSDIIFTGAPFSFPETFKSILKKVREVYTERKSPYLNYITMIEQMDPNSLEYANYSFYHAMSAGLYTPNKPSEDSKKISSELASNSDSKWLSTMTTEPVNGFYTSAKYTTLIIYSNVEALKSKVNIFGIYGKEDGLFDKAQLNKIQNIVGDDNLLIVDNASHNVFIDQQKIFIDFISSNLK